ncbi:hypothetical protein MIND_00129100 [Mycena indigotica]|uniref:Uncharacterized protein n=1 Tax=Mycena indigotica TaxID=2126181 RepID=A0A8H6TEN8_9AGAR|nr:uncharacterized protein MIND_00129100 [Mycena indigotica]KAF7316110.1 hypothetical protein MIND_00129100 [Mycena indigotica]
MELPSVPPVASTIADPKCSRCSRLPATQGRKTCEPCRIKHNEAFRRWRNKKIQQKQDAEKTDPIVTGKRSFDQMDPPSVTSESSKRPKLQALNNSVISNTEPPQTNPHFQKFTWASELYAELRKQYAARSEKKTFRFRGTHSIIADPTINNKRRARAAERDLKTHSGLKFKLLDRAKHREDDAYTITHRCSCLPTGCSGSIVIRVSDDHSHPLGWLGQRINIAVIHPKS